MQQETSFGVSPTGLIPHPSWFWLGLMGLLIGSVACWFGGVACFHVLVNDDGCFAKFANDYLTGIPSGLWSISSWLDLSRPHYIGQLDLLAVEGDPDSIAYHYASNMRHPFGWWQPAIAIILIAGVGIWTLLKIFARGTSQAQLRSLNTLGWTSGESALYILPSYLANWLPWAVISHCSSIYHPLPASLFSFLALAGILNRGLDSNEVWKQTIAGLFIGLFVLGCLFWLLSFGDLLLVTPARLEVRVWFEPWSW